MTLADFRSWLATLADAEAMGPARQVFDRLPEDGSEETPPTDPGPLELGWREKRWLVPAETRFGITELCEALGRSQSWAYRRTGSKAEDPLPHRLMDGQLVFTAGELRTWMRQHEESVHELPMDSTPAERALRVVGE